MADWSAASQAEESDLVTETEAVEGNVASNVEESISVDAHCATTSSESENNLRKLDEAVAKLNSEVRSLEAETGIPVTFIQRLPSDAEIVGIADPEHIASLDAAVAKLNDEVKSLVSSGNKYFDVSLYRESSTSPPPHPLTTYKWEDVKREKEKVTKVTNYFARRMKFHLALLGRAPTRGLT